MVRDYHVAASAFVSPKPSAWRPDPFAPAGTLVCHNDLSPANTVYRDGMPRAFIDWDHAVPSTLLWDLAYAVRTFVPLYSARDCLDMGYQADERARRLGLFGDAYGLTDGMREELLPTVRRRLEAQQTHFAERCRVALDEHKTSWAGALGV